MSETEIDVKSRMLLAAKQLFAKQGYDATTVRQIGESAAANIALVSYHFGGKEQLFHAMIVAFFPIRRLPELDQFDGDPLQALDFIIKEVSVYREREPEMVRIIQHEILLNSPRIHLIQEHVMPLWQELMRTLDEGRQAGIFQYESLHRTTMFVISVLLFNQRGEYWRPLIQAEDESSALSWSEEAAIFVKRALGITREII
ncbi:TetR family transcriptional regulator [Paenibacillus sp. ACRRX]|uniref:TetR/AcrR family transcriptional regulator n=1 Tax=Paenibacillus sp. ACRRX TaxID=2918206 RepID=UPI001EF5FDCC|nr:TetR/AcrR family transcriptional regulator [Paenibacillus sp. ACRRX]MCG7409769.1 TetR family transcriptional regulator [Paenibacillus sp. ACRRX]